MVPEIFHSYLKKHFIFSKLTEEQSQFIYPYIKFKSLNKGSRIFFDDANNHLYLILHGKMKLVDCANPENFLIKDILYAGEFFGDIFLQQRPPADEFAEVLTNNTILCYCPVNKVRELILAHPDLALVFATQIGLKLKRIQKRYLSLGGSDAESRLIRFLTEWAAIEGVRRDEKILVNRSMTLEEISDYIFVSRQTLYTLLKNLRKKSYLKWDRKQFIIDVELWSNHNHNKKEVMNSAGL